MAAIALALTFVERPSTTLSAFLAMGLAVIATTLVHRDLGKVPFSPYLPFVLYLWWAAVSVVGATRHPIRRQNVLERAGPRPRQQQPLATVWLPVPIGLRSRPAYCRTQVTRTLRLSAVEHAFHRLWPVDTSGHVLIAKVSGDPHDGLTVGDIQRSTVQLGDQ